MRKQHGGHHRPHGQMAARCPDPTDHHPIYMYGVLRRTRGPVAEALLGLRDEPARGMEPHAHRHADPRATDGHRFMFGVAAEQSPAAWAANPSFYFWDVGEA